MKGIILAGGSGTRLYPLTIATSKQLLPIYDKPMIYYPLSILMMSKIRDILIITTPLDLPRFKQLLKDGSQFGIKISYAVQQEPKGIAQAFIIGEKFIGNDDVCLVLGDNILYGNCLETLLEKGMKKKNGAQIFLKYVDNPDSFGIAMIDENGKVLSIEEKQKNSTSNYAVIGLYFYDNNVIKYAKSLSYSVRGELEITDLNKIYLEKGVLDGTILPNEVFWFDTGTIESLNDANNFIRSIEEKQEKKISVPEEIAYNNQWIVKKELLEIAKQYQNSSYGTYLNAIVNNNS